LEQPGQFLEAFEVVAAVVAEEVGLASDEVADGVGDEDLAAVGEAHDAGGLDHGGAVEVVVFFDRLASVHADADADRGAGGVEVGADGLLHGDGGVEGAGSRGEAGHEAVAHGLDLGAAVCAQGVAGQALVLAQDVAGLGVAEVVGEVGGGFDVGEEDGAQESGFGGEGVDGAGERFVEQECEDLAGQGIDRGCVGMSSPSSLRVGGV